MKTQPPFIPKSSADLQANTLAFPASLPERALAATQQALSPPARLTRRHSAEFMNSTAAQGLTARQLPQPWTRGGLNE